MGAAKPVDPATRLSELLAQSLEELTRPFDPPRVDPLTRPQQSVPPPSVRSVSVPAQPVIVPHDETEMPVRTESRLDDKALAELEAELFAAASKTQSEPSRAVAPPVVVAPVEETKETPAPDAAPSAPVVVDPFVDRVEQAAPPEVTAPTLTPASEPEPEVAPASAMDASTAATIAKVKRLMLITMGVTIIAVGSVFGFIGYRLFKVEGSVAKTADKVVPAPPSAGNEMTIAIPRGARVVQSAVSEDRLIMTLDVGGRIEVRTYDLKTLQPAGRLTFSTTP